MGRRKRLSRSILERDVKTIWRCREYGFQLRATASEELVSEDRVFELKIVHILG